MSQIKILTNWFPINRWLGEWWVTNDGDLGNCLFCPTFLRRTGGSGRVAQISHLKIHKFDHQHFWMKSFKSKGKVLHTKGKFILAFAVAFRRKWQDFCFFFLTFKDIFSPDFWRKTWVKFRADFWATLCVVLASLAGVSASFPSDRLAMIFQGYQEHTPCCFSFDKRSVYSTAVDLWPRGEMDKDFLLAKWWISQYNLDISNFTPKTFKIHLH